MSTKANGFLAFLILIISLIVIVIGISATNYYHSRFTREVTVERIWIKRSGSSTDKYLFSDTNGNVYEITDSTLLWLFDASDRWTKIEEGKTYRIEFIGWRSHFWSWYPNAIKIEEIIP